MQNQVSLNKTVASIGDALICLIPEQTQSLRYSEKLIRKPAGAEINSLIGLSRLGVRTKFITELEKGGLGRFMHHYLAGENIELCVAETQKPTPLYIKQTLSDGSVKVSYYRTKTAGSEMESLPTNSDFFKDIDLFLFSGIFPALSSANDRCLNKLTKNLKGSKTICVFDPNIRYKLFSDHGIISNFMQRYIRRCDLLFIGETEGLTIFGTKKPDEIYAKVQKLGVEHAVVKKGAEGSVIYENGKKTVIPAIYPKFILDTCGAGDAYNAGYIYAFLKGDSPEERGKIASLIASHIIQSYSDNENYFYAEDLNRFISTLKSGYSEIAESER